MLNAERSPKLFFRGYEGGKTVLLKKRIIIRNPGSGNPLRNGIVWNTGNHFTGFTWVWRNMKPGTLEQQTDTHS